MSVHTIELRHREHPIKVKTGRRLSSLKPWVAMGDVLLAAPEKEPPVKVKRAAPSLPLKMFANGPDSTVTHPIIRRFGVGNCVIAAMLNKVRHTHYMRGLPVPKFTSDFALELYSAITGFDPAQTADDGSNPTDQGTDPMAAFAYWQHHGIPLPGGGVHRIEGVLGVNPRDDRQWRVGLHEFDSLLTGYALPETIEQDGSEWVVHSLNGAGAPGSLGGHEILTVGYNTQLVEGHGAGQEDETWGERKRTSHAFLDAYCDQLTVVLDHDDLNKSGVSETGLDWERLSKAFEALSSLR